MHIHDAPARECTLPPAWLAVSYYVLLRSECYTTIVQSMFRSGVLTGTLKVLGALGGLRGFPASGRSLLGGVPKGGLVSAATLRGLRGHSWWLRC